MRVPPDDAREMLCLFAFTGQLESRTENWPSMSGYMNDIVRKALLAFENGSKLLWSSLLRSLCLGRI
jgi:hypothetical protein